MHENDSKIDSQAVIPPLLILVLLRLAFPNKSVGIKSVGRQYFIKYMAKHL